MRYFWAEEESRAAFAGRALFRLVVDTWRPVRHRFGLDSRYAEQIRRDPHLAGPQRRLADETAEAYASRALLLHQG